MLFGVNKGTYGEANRVEGVVVECRRESIVILKNDGEVCNESLELYTENFRALYEWMKKHKKEFEAK